MKKSLQKCYENYLGSGNPNAKFWFIGIEPGGVIDEAPSVQKHLENDNDESFINFLNEPLTDNIEPGFYTTLSEFLEKLKLYDCLVNDKFNFTQNCSAFFTNIFPLKFRGINQKTEESNKEAIKDYNYYFNEELADTERKKIYSTKWVEKRSELFLPFLTKNKKKILILTKSFTPYIQKLLNKNEFGEGRKPIDVMVGQPSTVDFYKISISSYNHDLIIIPNSLTDKNKIAEICNEIMKL